MTALRTTHRTARWFPPFALARWTGTVALLTVVATGCSTHTPPPAIPAPAPGVPGYNDPDWLTSREKLPAPPLDRLDYDPEKRTLILYELPGRDHWMVQLPDETVGRRVGSVHRLPEGVDLARTLVFYARSGVKVSAPVTVAAIEAGRRPHASLTFNR